MQESVPWKMILNKRRPAVCGAANILLRKGKSVEILANYEPAVHYVSEWWKQLYGESEGKDQKGLFPASVDLTTDLHSMGQFIQDGSRIITRDLVYQCGDLQRRADYLRGACGFGRAELSGGQER